MGIVRNNWVAWLAVAAAAIVAVGACGDDGGGDDDARHAHDSGAAGSSGRTDAGGGRDAQVPEVHDPELAEVVAVDRFSERAATLMVRDADNGLPGPDEPIDFDEPPFVTQGLGPDGQVVRYYNFDVQPTEPAPIYALFREGEDEPVAGQLNVIDVIPGDAGYNDFWRVHKVTVPEDYVANSIASLDEIEAMDLEIEPTELLVNCPVVPRGSTAKERIGGGSAALQSGWYRGELVKYFTFEEAKLMGESVPTSPIYVTFNVNPGDPGGGPPSGFVTEEDGEQTHNVVATLPEDDGYSPLWLVRIYDNADFAAVDDLASATDAELLEPAAATVNCPVSHVSD